MIYELTEEKMKTIYLIIVLAVICMSTPVSAEERLVDASHAKCKHGLHTQPNKGPFSIFLFCDDALGSNIGIILTERGAGPGNVPLNEMKVWPNWEPTKRFWQDDKWAADVINFAWGPSQRYMYVATSGIYGDGGFFKIDLREHSYQRLLPNGGAKYKSLSPHQFLTRIVNADSKAKKLTVKISYVDSKDEQIATETFLFE